MALTKDQRDALPADLFAVPALRALPIPDVAHCRMAWNVLDRTKGLTDAQRAEAKGRILSRASELGIDTSGWEAHTSARLAMQPGTPADGGMIQQHAMHFQAMALEFPENDEHPNKVPFSGVLTRVDEPSDQPVGGSGGKLVLIPSAVAEAALGTILGMGVDYVPGFTGHDARKKVGIITSANLQGNAVVIEGFLYGSDFPDVVSEIKSRKALLGFSYEAQTHVADWNADPLEVTDCTFTGAAILYKDRAAYTTTSLEASASLELNQMDINTLMEAVNKLTAQNEGLMKEITELKASSAQLAASNVLGAVKPHSDKLRACADGMEAAAMGGHERQGHVAVLRRMADKMDAEAMMGKLPHIWRDHDWLDAAAAPATDPKLAAQIDELTAELAKLKGAQFSAASEPARKTDPAPADRPALQAGANKPDFAAIDAELKNKGASTVARTAAMIMARAGITA